MFEKLKEEQEITVLDSESPEKQSLLIRDHLSTQFSQIDAMLKGFKDQKFEISQQIKNNDYLNYIDTNNHNSFMNFENECLLINSHVSQKIYSTSEYNSPIKVNRQPLQQLSSVKQINEIIDIDEVSDKEEVLDEKQKYKGIEEALSLPSCDSGSFYNQNQQEDKKDDIYCLSDDNDKENIIVQSQQSEQEQASQNVFYKKQEQCLQDNTERNTTMCTRKTNRSKPFTEIVCNYYERPYYSRIRNQDELPNIKMFRSSLLEQKNKSAKKSIQKKVVCKSKRKIDSISTDNRISEYMKMREVYSYYTKDKKSSDKKKFSPLKNKKMLQQPTKQIKIKTVQVKKKELEKPQKKEEKVKKVDKIKQVITKTRQSKRFIEKKRRN